MSFADGRDAIRSIVGRYESVRREAVRKLPQAKSVVFNVVADILYRIKRTLEYLSELEKVIGAGEAGFKRSCGNLFLIKAGDAVTALKLKPLQALTYDKGDGSISISNDIVKMVVSSTSVKFVFRGREVEFNYTNLDDAVAKVDIVKAIARYVIDLADRLQLCIEQCAKLHNIRL
ncbi:MAG: hypothetical protein J7L12_03430 [Desulfurococcales archaeon]|nr:hypothetical protein [Desulfurococcales archaeon]